jgi:hypothetical protein
MAPQQGVDEETARVHYRHHDGYPGFAASVVAAKSMGELASRFGIGYRAERAALVNMTRYCAAAKR